MPTGTRLDTALWKYRAKLHVDHTRVTADYTAFALPLVWNGSSGNLPSFLLDADGEKPALNGGADLRFTSDANGQNELPFDVVSFVTANDTANASAEVWVKLPSLSSTVDDVFYLWWGYASAVAYSSDHSYGRYNAFAAWSMVYHGNDANNNVSASFGLTNTNVTFVNGQVGKAFSFNGSNTYLTITGGLSAGNPNFGTYFTAMGWVKFNDYDNTYQRVFSWANNVTGTSRIELMPVASGGYQDPYAQFASAAAGSNGKQWTGSQKFSPSGTWIHYLMTWDNTTDELKLYINGAIVDGAVSSNNWIEDAARSLCYFGRSIYNSPPTEVLDGYLDEIRMGNSPASATYASIAYNAQGSPATFCLYDETLKIPQLPDSLVSVSVSAAWKKVSKWAYRLALTQDHTKVTNGPHADFPSVFLWDGSAGNLPSEMFTTGTAAKADGGDVRFSSDKDGNTELPFEIVSFTNTGTAASSSAEIWVKIPSVNNSTDTVIYLWWGNADATPYQATGTYGKYAVWQSSFVGIWHLDGSGAAAESTSNQNTGTNSGSTEAAGKIGKARDFNGSTHYISVADAASLKPASYITIQCWVKFDTHKTDGSDTLMITKDDTGTLRQFTHGWTSYGGGRYWAANIWDSSSGYHSASYTLDPTDGVWYHYTQTYDGSTYQVYLNGAAVGTPSSWSASLAQKAVAVNFGGRFTGGSTFPLDGKLDEIQISNTARSADWIATDYAAQNSPATFWGKGSVETMCPQIVISNAWKKINAIKTAISSAWKNI